jgi:hypothetical protein
VKAVPPAELRGCKRMMIDTLSEEADVGEDEDEDEVEEVVEVEKPVKKVEEKAKKRRSPRKSSATKAEEVSQKEGVTGPSKSARPKKVQVLNPVEKMDEREKAERIARCRIELGMAKDVLQRQQLLVESQEVMVKGIEKQIEELERL